MFEREQHGVVTLLRLAHGRASALDLEFVEGLDAELRALEDAPALVLTGRGRIFSAGVDLVRLRDGGAEYIRAFLPALHATFLRLFRRERPVVAALNGHAIAGGCVLACACDRRLMARGVGSVGVPELRVGVPFPSAALELVRRVVARGLDEVVLGGAAFDSDAALALGLVDELVEPADLEARAVAVATELAAIPARSFALTKRALRAPTLERIERAADDHDRAVLEAWTAPEVLAAVDAYVRATLAR